MQIDMKRFHAAFFDESAEHLAVMEESLLGLERNPDDGELLHRIFRAAHSIKGASGTFGFADIATFTHGLEGLLDRMRGGEITATPDLIQLLLRSADALSGLLSAAKDGEPPPAALDELLTALEAARTGRCPSPAPGAPAPAASSSRTATGMRTYAVTFLPGSDILHFGIDPFLVIRELAGLGKIVEMRLDVGR